MDNMPRVEPIERSMPPVTMIMVMPMAMTVIADMFRRMLNMFSWPRK